jgi:alkylation response protein AidB-like acyl-CoA dehydrogenase
MSDARPASSPRRDYAPPPVDGDSYKITDVFASEERPILARVRVFMEAEVAPIINGYWSKAKFPFELVPKLRELGIGGVSYEGFGCALSDRRFADFAQGARGAVFQFTLARHRKETQEFSSVGSREWRAS